MKKIYPSFKHLIGIPHEEKDCWDIVRDFYTDVLSTDLSHIYDGPFVEKYEAMNLIHTNKGSLEKITKPIFGDIVVMKVYNIECHIGVCIGNGLMLHSSKSSGSVIERLSRWQNAISGYYRVALSK